MTIIDIYKRLIALIEMRADEIITKEEFNKTYIELITQGKKIGLNLSLIPQDLLDKVPKSLELNVSLNDEDNEDEETSYEEEEASYDAEDASY